MATAWFDQRREPKVLAEIPGAEILVARRVEQVEGEPLMLELIPAEDTEMPRSRSTAIQSERTRRRPAEHVV